MEYRKYSQNIRNIIFISFKFYKLQLKLIIFHTTIFLEKCKVDYSIFHWVSKKHLKIRFPLHSTHQILKQ